MPEDPFATGSADPRARDDVEQLEDVQELEIRAELAEELANRFSYHPPKGEEQTDKYQELRASARAFAFQLCRLVPDSRERSLALTKLEECVMHANSGVARRT